MMTFSIILMALLYYPKVVAIVGIAALIGYAVISVVGLFPIFFGSLFVAAVLLE